MDLLTSFILAFFGGVFPTFIWLYFWLQEDKKHPEPKRVILRCFTYGMFSVPVAAIMQFIWNQFFINHADIEFLFHKHYLIAIITLVVWAAIEELLKYVSANKGGLSQKSNDEPVDPIVYMITAALGFAALENTFYLFNSIAQGESMSSVLITGNIRFIGATLLHISSSAVIGIFIALAYYKHAAVQTRYLLTGVVLSIVLHTIFNSFIIRSDKFTLLGFSFVWLVALYVILMFEKIKKTIKNK